jgi:uncharacterized membrane protein YkvA (DUF1232 family)
VSTLAWVGLTVGVMLFLYATFVGALIVGGRRAHAHAAARFIPDLVVLFRRLLGDPRLPRRHKLLVAALILYLAMPFDLVPDFIPVAGQLDDALIVALVLRVVVRGRPDLVAEYWPGPPESLRVIQRLAGIDLVPAGSASGFRSSCSGNQS